MNEDIDQDPVLSKKIKAQQIKLLYEQLPPALFGESVAATVLCIALWNKTNHYLLIGWLLFIYFGSAFWRSILVYLFKTKHSLLSHDNWLKFYVVGVFFTGAGWGIAGGGLMPPEGFVQQTFVMLMIFGVTAAANTLYSPILSVYTFFLIIALAPLSIWLLTHGGLYVLLGFLSFIYFAVLLSTAYYTNKLILSSLVLRFKNINLGSIKKLLEKKVAERTNELKESLAITKSAFESTADGILMVTLDNKIKFYNKKFLDMWGFTSEFIKTTDDEKAIQHVMNQLINPDEFVSRINDLYLNPNQDSFDELHFKDGRIFERYSKPHKLDHKIIGRVWTFRDITERRKMEKKIAYQANHDALTGLPNRTLLNDRIHQGITYAKRFHSNLIVMFIDLDNFKDINDNLGHGAGDILLQETALRLEECIRESDTVARFGGDEFVLLFLFKNGKEEIKTIVNKIHDSLKTPIQIGGHEVVVTVSMGISIYPRDGQDPSTLLKNADVAMYKAKKKGRNYYQLYDKSMNIHSKKRMIIQNQLRGAIEKNEFFLFYQPIFDLKTNKVISVEALLRWQHPEIGLIFPNEIIPIAEETGFIIQLGEWVMRQACLQNKMWQNQGLRPIVVAVNVSGVQLNRPNFVETVRNILSDSQLDPQYLELELTESAIMSNTKEIIKRLADLKNLGVQIAIDDFGTGYSSFSYLKNFPANKLKIDKSFVQDCTINPNDRSIINAIITMGHHMNLSVLAEGVETESQLRLLQESHCDEMQGFLYGRPTNSDEINELLKNNHFKE